MSKKAYRFLQKTKENWQIGALVQGVAQCCKNPFIVYWRPSIDKDQKPVLCEENKKGKGGLLLALWTS